MGIDLDRLDAPKQRWIGLPVPLAGVEILLKHCSPRDGERFRQKLVRDGVLRSARSDGWDINQGRQDDFFAALCQWFILDWRGDITPEGAPYDAFKMGRVLGASNSIFEYVTKHMTDDMTFFEPDGGGSSGT